MRHPRSKPPPVKPIPPAPAPGPVRRLPQFNLLGLMVVTLICSVASSGIYYLVRAEANEAGMRLTALLFILAGPMLLLVIVSLLVALLKRYG
ncbi:hypothetical protein ETAA8_06410 [Anatilimnocola aggregata]|uniref:Uncharacterized protein n=1 Tax=Anatilimnocola aggregata TaxID=2528021 RepID=A0A517Y622_9BACT|nr:hypothetical protein [Anatilimnocola aggregata]QDU25572.1 hypothetical protein ETAA8_06410 [Anatilimnocola aggregata]